MDDPLGLVVGAVWLLAAGMYPVGFLFGTCSGCCPQCPEVCSKCTHYVNSQSVGSQYFAGSGRTLTVSVTGHNTVTINNPAYEPCESAGNELFLNVAAAPVPTWKPGHPVIPAGQAFTAYAAPYICVGVIEREVIVDECDCNVAQARIGLSARFFYNECPVSSTQFSSDVVLTFDGCNVTAQTANTYTPWTKGSGCNFGDFASLLAWLNNLAISVSLTIPACDCGACCDSNCEENVAEGGCAAWQGVGVDCDPDPCV